MPTVRHLSTAQPEPLPEWAVDDVRTPPAFARQFLAEATEPGDVVLDPFAGFGTTLRVATAMDRRAYGLERSRERAVAVRERGDHGGRLVRADARHLDAVDLPPVDCCLTAPPFMLAGATGDPLANYAGDVDYDDYCASVADVFELVADQLAPDGVVLVDVANLRLDGAVTTLAWDLAGAIQGGPLQFDGEVVVVWVPPSADHSAAVATPDDAVAVDGPLAAPRDDGRLGYGYDHSYCLTFSLADQS